MTFWSAERLNELQGRRVIVLGDVMLDTFVYGQCTRISPEAPIPVVRIGREDVMLGGAGNVARNIAALGGEAILIGLAGHDTAGLALRAKVTSEPGIQADLVSDGRPTTQKTRYIAAQQQMLRVDAEQTHAAAPEPLLAAFARHLPQADAVVLSDYAKGTLSPDLLRDVIAQARAAGKPVIADPKSSDVSRYDGVTLMTPNAGEASTATGIPCDGDDRSVTEAAEQLLQRMAHSPAILITRGPRGMTLAERGRDVRHLPALAREVFDVSGAGDTVIATLALSAAAGLPLMEGVELANVAAGMAVAKPGTAVVTADELARELRQEWVQTTDRKIKSPDEALTQVARWRSSGKRIGFTNGCFDLIHPGHVSQLAQARSTCDHLIVGLNTDASIQRLKGPLRPVQHEDSRAIVLASLQSVDLVILFDDDTPIGLIDAIRPDVLIKGKDYTVDQVVGSSLVLGYGGEVFLADIAAGHSTSDIIDRLTRKVS
ncbi:D-alpha,beta-D-heptose 7-phosphate 1-kinase /D-beta-D-heptose 1-phosphate adenylyltransferase [Methylobacterium phyllostachyos]|uniref:Bifunctional protein HldE n=1 Tax=Methylobacterium phyllostachyos TaxID=582672 RepID=A0A1H0I4U9_9HYPH|nr:D-glycero-beta-D-manno-heptose-7-phosphate kinase [Methylobacterium phyllostachyos]SDO26478.1 D-alpha,beta-D-heptose 7-phosphate 1-kinase /D-beta-D-heptose 1-phosphate adenylyltransferase [Methylobacterium phyllostachyos]